MSSTDPALDLLCTNTIRTLAIDAVEAANSGHPGLPMGAAPMAYTLWQRHMKHNPADPCWPDRDRFILSAGHGSALLYSLLHLTGYDLPLEEVKNFRQWGSRTPGHPEFGVTAGVEATTGPLGQGTANSVGMALTERRLAERYNRPGHAIVDHRTWALVSDGDLMEGLSAEAAALAGHWKLGKLTWLYDANGICLDGPTDTCFTEDVAARFRAQGWHVVEVQDGDTGFAELDAAISASIAESERPSLLIVRTTIGYGSPNKGGTAGAHGSPLGPEETALTKKALNWPSSDPFHIPDAAAAHLRNSLERGAGQQAEWLERFDAWSKAHAELAAEWNRVQAGELPGGWESALPTWDVGEKLATRAAGGSALNAAAGTLPEVMGGDADLSCSTKTALKGESFFHENAGRNIQFGVREHAMGAIANGMAYHGGLRPFTATFFVFSDYMRPAIRLAAMNHLPVTFVFTHDSIGVGEDGPTHQPVEHLAALRSIPGLWVMRPADANETAQAWRAALERKNGPTVIVLSRQGLPVFEQPEGRAPVERGAYVVADGGASPAITIVATGSEVSLAMEANALLSKEGIQVRIVSMPSCEAFAEQPETYRESVLPSGVPRVTLEAGVTFGWERWAGSDGVCIGLDRFGASAPGNTVFEKLGFTAERVAEVVRTRLGKPVGARS